MIAPKYGLAMQGKPPASGSVFVDLGFDETEARVMALRVELMVRLAA